MATRRHPLLPRWLMLLVVAVLPATAPAAGDELWQRLAEGGLVVMMRHALAPGTGDPADFTLGDCSTQRNLSDAGREQARRIGQALRDHGVPVDAVMSSQWCRCMETAELLGAGDPAPAPMLNSFFRDRSTETAQTGQTVGRIAAWDGAGNLVLVTHQVNITAATGVYPASGEMVVLAPRAGGEPEVLGTIEIR